MSTITTSDRSVVEIASITDVEAAEAYLSDLDTLIISMERQIEDASQRQHDPSWMIRCRMALKHRRRERQLLQAHKGELKRKAKAEAHLAGPARAGMNSTEPTRRIRRRRPCTGRGEHRAAGRNRPDPPV